MSTDLVDRARAGDGQAFGELVGPYRRELQVHCYQGGRQCAGLQAGGEGGRT